MPCVHLGYPADHRGYRCLDLQTRRVITSRHVVFDETQFPFRSAPPIPSTAAGPATVPDEPVILHQRVQQRVFQPPHHNHPQLRQLHIHPCHHPPQLQQIYQRHWLRFIICILALRQGFSSPILDMPRTLVRTHPRRSSHLSLPLLAQLSGIETGEQPWLLILKLFSAIVPSVSSIGRPVLTLSPESGSFATN